MTTTTRRSPTTLLTADDLLRLSSDDVSGELIRGRLFELPRPGMRHGQLALRLGAQLLNHVEARQLGTVVSEVGVLLEREPDTVRAPDAAYFSHARLPIGGAAERYGDTVPELVVEVVSPSDRRSEVYDKARMWLSFGVLLAWVVFPQTRTVEVHRAGTDEVETLALGDDLGGGSVLPGFVYPLRHLFAA